MQIAFAHLHICTFAQNCYDRGDGSTDHFSAKVLVN